MRAGAVVVWSAMLAGGVCAGAQVVGFDQPKAKGFVVYAAEQQSVRAGRAGVLEMHFKVLEGFHVNSHRPKSEFQIATALKLEPAAGVKVEEAAYPAGTEYRLEYDPTEKLDVYTGAFTVKVPVVAAAGEHVLAGVLKYQACDRAACYPPKTLPVQVVFTAK